MIVILWEGYQIVGGWDIPSIPTIALVFLFVVYSVLFVIPVVCHFVTVVPLFVLHLLLLTHIPLPSDLICPLVPCSNPSGIGGGLHLRLFSFAFLADLG